MEVGPFITRGVLSYKGITINTQGFKEDEVSLLVEELSHKFKIVCTKGKNKNRWVIRISSKSYKHLSQNIGPYIHPSMKGKFPYGLDLKSTDKV